MSTPQKSPSQITFEPNQVLEIKGFQGDAVITERMREMGLHHNAKLRYLRRAPFGGPFLFQFSTTILALRQEELACLMFKLS